jgi:aminoglycoside 6'-N-acetyltransferase I
MSQGNGNPPQFGIRKNVRQIGRTDLAGGGQVVVENGYAFVGHMDPPHGTTILDVKDPKHPKIVAEIEIPQGVHSHKVRVSGNVMLVNLERYRGKEKQPTGLKVYDISNRERPKEGWLRLRQELWPHCSREEHLTEMSSFCARPERFAQFVAYAGSGQAVGFIEVAVRTDYVNGTDSSPVAFVEGIYVVPEARRMGTARALVAAAERWAANKGCREIASDAGLENETSHAMHRALGFQETERVVFFRKLLT